ncbi:hypothetical protein ABPG77_000985 [Micractinium sp. CCAP 211/92]
MHLHHDRSTQRQKTQQTCCASRAAEPRTQFHENKRGAPAASAVVTAAALAAMDHQLYEGGAYHPQQQPVFLLDDDHDHWPVHQPVSAGAPAPASQAEPLPPLTGGGSANPAGAAAPMVPVDNLGELEDDEEATESENERGGGTRAMARLHHLPSAGYRPDSALTGASRQPSPSPSVNLHGGLTPAAQASAAPPRAQQAASSLPVPRGGSKGGGKARKPGGKGGITLRLLIEEGILQPGHNVLSVDYKGMKQLATLLADGRISSSINGSIMTFESPSAFSIYLKRLVNPTRKADDGWKTVRYNNRVLEQYKGELAKQRLAEGSSSGLPASLSAGRSDQQYVQQQQQQQQQPPHKRARVGSSSDLTTGGSLALSATIKEGDRNVLKLKFAQSRNNGGSEQPGRTQQEEQLTEYQRSRPQRQVQPPPRLGVLGQDVENALQPLEAFAPGLTGTLGAQPFSLYISPAAELIMDFHAHLCLSEVIGVLAGVFDPTNRTVSVLEAHPVQESSTEDDSVNVEMDPADEWAVRQQIHAAGLRVVGWYHSHPTFPTQPSTIDIYNQVLQQHHHRDEAHGTEPFVAAIVGPYDKCTAGPASSITWFYVDHPSGVLPAEGQRPERVGCVAKAMQTLRLLDGGGGGVQAEISGLPNSVLQQLAQRYVGKPDAVNMFATWREGLTTAQKLVASLMSRLPPSHLSPRHMQDFCARVQDIVMTTLGHTGAGPYVLAEPDMNGAAMSGGAALGALTVDGTAEAPSEEEISDLSA